MTRGFRTDFMAPQLTLLLLAMAATFAYPREASGENARVPPARIVKFQDPSVWQNYKWPIAGVSAFLLVQAILIFRLLVQRANWRRADNRFRQAVEAAPNGMLIVEPDGTIIHTNPQIEWLFGYTQAELIGQPVEMLVPESLRDEHARQRSEFSSAPEIRQMGIGREISGLRKDGTVIPVEIGLSPLKTSEGLCVLASVIDITARRQALEDLEASRHQLRQLSIRLIEAQEQERRRIARELHDDFNQSLALFGVKLDLLRQKLPQTNVDLKAGLDELASQVRELSTALHELSHELHPLKLEQLGLATSIRSLCQEFSKNHELTIDFTPSQVPATIPPETALCLYRIVQESLRNIIKHSRAQAATIRITGEDEVISLHITDEGVGFDAQSIAHQAGLGFVSMRERLRLIGGEIAINSQPSKGTRIMVSVPLQSAN